MEMQIRGNWQPLVSLGEGGQGDVFLACDASKASLPLSTFGDIEKFLESIPRMTATLGERRGEKRFEATRVDSNVITAVARAVHGLRFGALKVLKDENAGWRRDSANAKKRFEIELQILQKIDHPNLLKLIDANLDQLWFVTTYFKNGSLDGHHARFRDRPREALLAFHGLVEAVAELHSLQAVHRDIKPENIFISDNGCLVLGDMGLVYLDSDDNQRVTATHDNVGTRDWMAPWAIGRRQEEVSYSLDVYGLGKILWSIVAGSRTCAAYHVPRAVEGVCDDKRTAKLIDRIVASCVVAREHECIPDARVLLEHVEEAIAETRLPAPSMYLRMAAHAFSRPGGQYLFSAEWPFDDPAQITPSQTTWWIRHPALGSDRRMIPPHEWSNLGGFLCESEEYQRWAVTFPEPRSSDNELDCEFPAIPICLAKYFQFMVIADTAAEFRIYLRFDDGDDVRWIAYSPGGGTIDLENSREYRIPVIELVQNGMMVAIIRDLEVDLRSTWKQEKVRALTGLRLRGAFKLLFARIS